MKWYDRVILYVTMAVASYTALSLEIHRAYWLEITEKQSELAIVWSKVLRAIYLSVGG